MMSKTQIELKRCSDGDMFLTLQNEEICTEIKCSAMEMRKMCFMILNECDRIDFNNLCFYSQEFGTA